MKIRRSLLIYKRLVIFIFCLITICQTALAESSEKSFSGKISIGGGVIVSKNSGLAANSGGIASGDSPENWNGTDSPAKKETHAFPAIELELGYTFYPTGTTLFSGWSAMGDGVYLGLHQYLGKAGNISVTGFVSEEDVWKDPYLIGAKRTRTKKSCNGAEVVYDSILETGAEVSLGFNKIDVKKDFIGDRYQQLRRDGFEVEYKIACLFKIDDAHGAKPFVSYSKSDIKGDANSYDAVSFGFSHSLTISYFSFQTELSYLKADFNETHPVFNKTREDKSYGLSHNITWNDIFGLKDWSASVFGFYGKTDSNIYFFDEYGAVGGAKITYEF